jgi:hypothetical protein
MNILHSLRPGYLLIVGALFSSLFFVSCQKDTVSTVDCTGLTPTYTRDIKPILNASCALSGCHTSYTAQAGIDLSNFNSASEASLQDRFLGSIQQKKGYRPMPQNAAQLSADKIQLITCWVQNGSPD